MESGFLENLADKLPFGCGYCQLLVNTAGVAEDYVFLEVSPSFERLAGLRQEEAAGKKASQIAGWRGSGNFEWLSFCVNAVRLGMAQETTQWFEGPGQYHKVTVVPQERETFLMIIQNDPGSAANVKTDKPQKEQNNTAIEELEIIFNSTHDAISLVEYRDGEFRYIRNNAQHRKLSGITDMGGKTPVELLGKDVGEKLRAHYERCMRTGQPISYEQTFDFVTGKKTWLTDLTPVFDSGKIRYLVGSSRDVTDLKAEQREKEALLQRMQSMFERHTAVKLLIEPASGRIVDANPSACDFYGYSREELCSLSIMDINALPVDEVAAHRRMAFEQKQRYFVFPHRLKNGEIRFVDVYSSPIADGERTLLYSIIFDVTDRETYKKELVREKEMLRTTLQSIGDGVVTTDNDGMITCLNGVAQELTGWTGTEAQGRSFTEVFRLQSEETGEPVENPIQKVLENGRIVGLANHTVLFNRQGQAVPIADSAAPIRMEDGGICGVVMVFRDVSKDKEQSDQIQYLSYHDPLTGLFNRHYIEQALKRLDTPGNLPISVVMGDVNGLKITNDVFGHEAGDVLLKNVADTLEKSCRPYDLAARWGGDEFVILMPKTDLTAAEEIVQRIKSNCDAASNEDALQGVSLSLGCAAKTAPEDELRGALQKAEEYMYHQKLLDGKSYRNAIINALLGTLFEKSMETEEHAERLEMLCRAMGGRLGLTYKEMDELSLLAILHDIGKIGISKSVLQKPTRLSPVEWEEMKRHPEIGYRIAQTTPELAVIADLVLSHHERWDGGGYPRGLRGEDIPMACRILAVADAYDAMTNDRSYRIAMSKTEALMELKKNAGTQFDPAVVSLFVESIFAAKHSDYSPLQSRQPTIGHLMKKIAD